MKAPVFDIAVIADGVNGGRVVHSASGKNQSTCHTKYKDLTVYNSLSASTKLACSNLHCIDFFEFRASFMLSIHHGKIFTNRFFYEKVGKLLSFRKPLNNEPAARRVQTHDSRAFQLCKSYQSTADQRNKTAGDILWSRTNPGLVFTTQEAKVSADWMNTNMSLYTKLSH